MLSLIADMNFQDVIIVVLIHAAHSSPVDAQFTCVGTCYKGNFIEESHVTSNKALVGHSFLNLTVYAPHQCLSACLARCRCMAFQLEGTRCELLDQERSLIPEDFHQVQGYKYFDVKQALNRKVSEIVNYLQSNYFGVICCFYNDATSRVARKSGSINVQKTIIMIKGQ